MTFERTYDLNLIRSILTGPGIYPYIGDDSAPAREEFQPNADARIWYVLAIHRCEVAGMFMLLPENGACWQVHVSMLRGVPPAVTHQAGREILPWIWRHADCRRIVAHVPVTNRAAVRFGLRVMRAYGRNVASFLTGGRLVDQIDMGCSRPEGF